MRQKVLRFSLLFLLIPFCNGCKFFEKNYEKIIHADGTEELNKNTTIEPLISDGEEISILPSEWMDFKNKATNPADVDNYFVQDLEISRPEPATIKWTNKKMTGQYKFLLSTNKDMSDSKIYELEQEYIQLKDLFAGTRYYYQIRAEYSNYYVISKLFNFKTVDFFRTIQISGVYNARDFGNKKTNNGKQRVKQGLVYRTANFDGITSNGKAQAIERYGIKTDLDLREKIPTESPIGPNIKYINNGVGTYGSPHYVSYDHGINVAEYQVAMRDNLKVFADKNNFPLAFHCAVGRDRTGTLAITLYLLLGINLEEIRYDYAVSFFSKVCNNYTYSDFEQTVEGLFKYFERYKGDGLSDKANIYERAEAYCLHVGLSKEEIVSIRNNLLEDIKK